MTDVRKAVTVSDLSKPRRPQTLSRRQTPQTVQKLGKSARAREKEWEEERWFEDDRESFPQFWYVTVFPYFWLFPPPPPSSHGSREERAMHLPAE